MKRVQQTILAVALMALTAGSAFAQQIGVVDIQEVSGKYYKAVSLANEVKVKEDELKKLREDLLTQLKAGEKLSPVEKKTLEDKLNTQFANKFNEYRNWTATQEQTVRTDIDTAVKQVAGAQRLDLVLPKQVVMQGGKDVTQDVINALNK